MKGKVVLQGSADSSGAIVTLIGGERTQVQVTGADGAYAFESLADATYQLTAEAAETIEGRRSVAVEVAEGKGGEVPNLVLTGAGTLNGVVTAQGATHNAGIAVSVAGTSLSATTAMDGSFTLEKVPAGAHTLIARLGNAVATANVEVKRGTQDVPAFTLGRGDVGTVRGTVAVWDRDPNVEITLGVPELDVSTKLAADGKFELSLPAGEWNLVATATTYPKQTVARVKVEGRGVVELGTKRLTAWYRFGVNEPTQYEAYSRLLEDGVHALISREGYENLTHSIVNVETGEERMFLVEWNWLDDPEAWVTTSNGSHVAYAQNVGWHDGSTYRQAFEAHVFDTTSGTHRVLRRPAGTSNTRWESASFTEDGSHFFACDDVSLIRLNVGTGDDTSLPAQHLCMRVGPGQYLTVGRFADAESASVFHVNTATADEKVTRVESGAAMLDHGNKLVVLTDCMNGACNVKIVDGVSGNVTTVSGGTYPLGSNLLRTNHPDWIRLEGAGVVNAFVNLTTGTATVYPNDFTTGHAAGAQLNPTGNRIAFEMYAAPTYSLFVAPFPLTAVPAIPVSSSASPHTFEWLSAARLVATDANRSGLVDVQATATNLTDVTPNSVRLGGGTVMWQRASDLTTVALVGDSTPIVLSSVETVLPSMGYPWWGNGGPVQGQTRGNTWTLWLLHDQLDGRYTTVARRASDGTLRSFVDVAPWTNDDGFLTSKTGFMGSVYSGDGQDIAVDLDTGTRRQVWEVDLDDEEWGVSSSTGEAEYLMGRFLTGRNVQLWNNEQRTVYDTGVLRF